MYPVVCSRSSDHLNVREVEVDQPRVNHEVRHASDSSQKNVVGEPAKHP